MKDLTKGQKDYADLSVKISIAVFDGVPIADLLEELEKVWKELTEEEKKNLLEEGF